MYNQGLIKFMEAKQVSSKETINKFLLSEGILDFNYKNHNRVNSYIQDNWVKFASFVDKSIKSGYISGKSIKLNTYYDEQEIYRNNVREEFNSLNLSKEEKLLLNKVKKEGTGFLAKFLASKGLNLLKNDLSYTSKTLRNLPSVRLAIENGYFNQ